MERKQSETFASISLQKVIEAVAGLYKVFILFMICFMYCICFMYSI